MRDRSTWLEVVLLCVVAGCAGAGDEGGRGAGAPGVASGAVAGGGPGASPAGASSSAGSHAGGAQPGVGVNEPVGDASVATAVSNENGKCGAVSQMAKNTRQPADIIFSVDTSGSMGDEIRFVKENLNAFSRKISESGVDARVVLIGRPIDGTAIPLIEVEGVCIDPPLGSGRCPDDSKAPSYVHIPVALGDWNVLQAYVDNYPRYKEYLRPNSVKTFVTVTDGDLDNIALLPPISTADKLIEAVKGLEPNSPMWNNWRYSGIYCFTDCAFGSGTGKVHAELVQRTQGVGGDLCLQNFAPVFDELAKSVTQTSALACDWEIPPPPKGETFSPTKTNVQITLEGKAEQLLKAPGSTECGEREGWHYDDPASPRRVVACPTTCKRIQAAREAKVDLLFGCATVELF